MGIEEVIGQDIAESALDLARARYNYDNIRLLSCPITKIDFPELYFDLVISNRVLMFIPPGSIETTVKTICRLARFAYINELSDSDGVLSDLGFYRFKYEYVRLFEKCGFSVKNVGFIDKQKWILFGEIL